MLTEQQPTTILRGGLSDASDTAGASLLDELMTATQLADLMQMRISTIEDYARRGLLPSVKLGRHRRFIRSEVERAVVALARRPTGRPR